MKNACVDKLLKDNEAGLLRERRDVDRRQFTRPVTIQTELNCDAFHEGFSRELSSISICIISPVECPAGTHAHLTVHTISIQKEIRVTAEAKWTEPFGKDWFLTEWHFIAEA